MFSRGARYLLFLFRKLMTLVRKRALKLMLKNGVENGVEVSDGIFFGVLHLFTGFAPLSCIRFPDCLRPRSDRMQRRPDAKDKRRTAAEGSTPKGEPGKRIKTNAMSLQKTGRPVVAKGQECPQGMGKGTRCEEAETACGGRRGGAADG